MKSENIDQAFAKFFEASNKARERAKELGMTSAQQRERALANVVTKFLDTWTEYLTENPDHLEEHELLEYREHFWYDLSCIGNMDTIEYVEGLNKEEKAEFFTEVKNILFKHNIVSPEGLAGMFVRAM